VTHWLQQIFNRICDKETGLPKARIHGLRMCVRMSEFPFASVDGSAWVVAAKNGRMPAADGLRQTTAPPGLTSRMLQNMWIESWTKAHKCRSYKLHGLREGHKCGRMHGHNYRIEVTITGLVTDQGFVVDAEEIDRWVGSALMDALDHRTLNAVIEQPTAENIAAWVLALCSQKGMPASRVRVQENDRLWAEVVP
jgi:6-pyruvoyltetrahydropterin/6-carboxytetrahydropterin synthase